MSTFYRLAASVAVGAGIAASVLYAPQAHADSSSFLDRMHGLGWSNNSGDAYLLDNGLGVCRSLAAGYTGPQVGAYVYTHTDLSVTVDDAVEFVTVAVEELCPSFDHRGQSVA